MRVAILWAPLLSLIMALGCAAPAVTPTTAPTKSAAPTSTQTLPGPKISVQAPWVRPALAGQNSAAYFVIVNEGSSADVLTGVKVSSSIAKMAEIHQTKMEGGVMKMSPAPNVEVPAGSRVEFKPGGYHVMLMELQRELKEGETISITLTFEKSGNVTLEAPVKSQS